MERIIHLQLVCALESKHLITDSQHGFRHKRSTVILLLQKLMTAWAFCLEGWNSVHCVLLEAFDSVPHCHPCLSLNVLVSREIYSLDLTHF